ncbi:MAG: hypothetical protein HY298_23385 [Verrucomicrobia bacterium]|nr:hypothetical protein [Verrucomicrobiota bacterium]
MEQFGGSQVPFEHHICFQGVEASTELRKFLRTGQRAERIICHFWDRNYGTGEGNNRIVPLLRGALIMKLDEDAMFRSPDFFVHVMAVHKLVPDAVFSPYPVGLIGHPGGDKGERHFVKYSDETDTYYTFRSVPHTGGLARIAPARIAKGIHCPYDLNENSGREDESFAEACLETKTPMYYLENALIVEHQESTLGQMERYKEYFGGRTDFKTNSRLKWAIKRILGK